ncbi:MAG: hypothetical protein JW932_11380 [Deltaproteobacteria bacterium]|nr:hypothetical protein [Deltaproteobacteria bacterium]
MILSFHPCIVADRQIILGARELNAAEHTLIHRAEVIILPQSCSYNLYKICRSSPALVFPDYDIRFEYPGKSGQARLFLNKGFPHPKTFQWNSLVSFENVYNHKRSFPHEMPFIIKTNNDHEGRGVYFIKNEESLEEALEKMRILEQCRSEGFITQEWIPSKGNVLRAVVMDKNIITYWKRNKNNNTVISTVGLGAEIDPNWEKGLQEKGREQAHRFSIDTGINLAAIDFIFSFEDLHPKPLFLEINYYFGRRGLGGSLKYYRLLIKTVREWLRNQGFDPKRISMA